MGLFSKLAKATRKGIPGRDSGGGMGSAMARPAAPRPTLVQGGPAYFTPEGYTPPMQPQQAFMPTDTMGDPIGDMFRAQPIRKLPKRLPPDDRRFPPPRDIRDEFISIGGVGGRDGREERMPPVMPSVDETPMDIPMDNMMIDRPMISGLENPNLFNFDFSNIDMDAINQRIADAGGTIPQDSVMPPIDTPAQPRIDAIREARGMPPRIKDNFMSIDRMDEPRDITNMGQSLLDSYDAGLNNLSPYEQTIRQIARDEFIPPKRDDFMSIGGPGGGITDDRAISPLERPNFIGRQPFDGPAAPIMPLPKERIGPPRILPPGPPRDIGRQPIPPQDFGFGSGIMPPTPDFLPEEMPMIPNTMPMPMQQRMPMPAPIASPIPLDPMPMAPVDLPRLELPKINRMDRMNVMDRPIPMMPRMGGMGRR
jgi:hypothetical protein